MGQTLDELWGGAVTHEVQQSNEPQWEWPVQGAEYELFVVKLPDCDDPPEFLDLPIDLHHLFDGCGIRECMTGDFFPEEQIIEEPGLWKIKIRYTVDYHTDWETGIREDEFMLEVLEKTKI